MRCQENAGFEELIAIGANHVFPEMLESSLLLASHVLNLLDIDEFTIREQIAECRQELVTIEIFRSP